MGRGRHVPGDDAECAGDEAGAGLLGGCPPGARCDGMVAVWLWLGDAIREAVQALGTLGVGALERAVGVVHDGDDVGTRRCSSRLATTTTTTRSLGVNRCRCSTALLYEPAASIPWYRIVSYRILADQSSTSYSDNGLELDGVSRTGSSFVVSRYPRPKPPCEVCPSLDD